MSSQERDSARRKSFRCRVPDAQQGAVLKVGRRRFPVRLVNESAEGAAAWSEQDTGVKADDVVELSTTFGRFEARVVHVAKIDSAGIERENQKPGFRIGLEWLQALKMPPGEQGQLHDPVARSP